MKIYIIPLLIAFLCSAVFASDDTKEQNLKSLINSCMQNGDYFQTASEKLSFFISTDAKSYFACSDINAEKLYNYLERYTNNKVSKIDGEARYISRNLSKNVRCVKYVSNSSVICSFHLDIDEDVINSEEE